MKRGLISFLTFLLLSAGALARNNGQADGEADARALAEAERGFCRDVAAKGVRGGFLANLADDGVLFRPHPVPGKKFLEASPARPGLLTWEPAFAEASGGGDLGYTTGPWEFRNKSPEEEPAGRGNYMSIWKKQPDGTWKVALDLGIGNTPGEPKPSGLKTHVNRSVPASRLKAVGEADKAALMSHDREFLEAFRAKGVGGGYAPYASDDIRMLRDGKLPVIGKKAALALLSERQGELSWQPVGGDLSRAGDLGYTYGKAEFAPQGADAGKTEYFNYVHIWRREPGGSWKLVLDLATASPPPSK
ncbi:MAG TPA: nuclear transport factor 2 family protein [Blastocatellia bacterium]|jgi:ketosteroid isomerase-like protein|nr:nuclear transport factor 2 family protein [Blastocatellia bacterium]